MYFREMIGSRMGKAGRSLAILEIDDVAPAE